MRYPRRGIGGEKGMEGNESELNRDATREKSEGGGAFSKILATAPQELVS